MCGLLLKTIGFEPQVAGNLTIVVYWSIAMEQPALVVTETEDAAKKDQTPLWQLAEAGDLDRVKIALNNGAQVVRFFFKSLFFVSISNLKLSLSLICHLKVNEVGPGGSTPLMLAVNWMKQNAYKCKDNRRKVTHSNTF